MSWPDNWTAVTKDGRRSAQFEHTFLVTESGLFLSRSRSRCLSLALALSRTRARAVSLVNRQVPQTYTKPMLNLN